MNTTQARLLLLTAAWMESWNDTLGHPDVERHNHASTARQAAEEAIAVLCRAAHDVGREEAYREVNGQLRL